MRLSSTSAAVIADQPDSVLGAENAIADDPAAHGPQTALGAQTGNQYADRMASSVTSFANERSVVSFDPCVRSADRDSAIIVGAVDQIIVADRAIIGGNIDGKRLGIAGLGLRVEPQDAVAGNHRSAGQRQRACR